VCLSPGRPVGNGSSVANVPGDILSADQGNIFVMCSDYADMVENPQYDPEADPETNPEAVAEFVTGWTEFGTVTRENHAEALEKGVAARVVSRLSSRRRMQVFLEAGRHLKVFVGTRPENYESRGGRRLCVGSEFLLTSNNDPIWAVAENDALVSVVEELC